jgi:hypothetical protein
LSSYQKEIGELKDALGYLKKGDKIPVSNPNNYKKKEEIQKSLAIQCRLISARINKLNSSLTEIKRIINFFLKDNKFTGFVYLTNAIFSEGSNFDEGYATVNRGSNKMYFSFNGKAYEIESELELIPKIEKQRPNPNLIPFQIETENYSYLMGYKNPNGEIVIPAIFKSASHFFNGFAKVSTDINLAGNSYVKYGLIDEAGRMALHFENPFFEIENVYNDIVKYKRHMYKDDMVQTWNFDWKPVTIKLGLLSGYLIYGEIKPAIYREIEMVNKIENSIPTLKTNSEVDKAREKIQWHRDIIELKPLNHIVFPF